MVDIAGEDTAQPRMKFAISRRCHSKLGTATNTVVVPCRIQSWVIVPARPFFIGRSGLSGSKARPWREQGLDLGLSHRPTAPGCGPARW
jgi:hypothetical protein